MCFIDLNLVLRDLNVSLEIPCNNAVEVTFMVHHLNLEDVWGLSLNDFDNLNQLPKVDIDLVNSVISKY